MHAIDHSSGSIGGRPDVCRASVRSVTMSRGAPGTRNFGKYFATGSSQSSRPSAASIDSASAVIDLESDAMPKTVSMSAGVPAASLRPKLNSNAVPPGPIRHAVSPGSDSLCA